LKTATLPAVEMKEATGQKNDFVNENMRKIRREKIP